MIGGDNGSSGDVLKSKGDGTMEWGTAINPPTFSSVDYPGDDTALDPAGGQSLVINGGTFNSGITVTIGGTSASSVTVNSSSQITVTTPAKTAGTYDIVFTNTDGGTATASNAVSYNGIPAFTNAAGSLGSVEEGATVNLSAAATEPDGGAIAYTITSGALPTGLSINASTGAITGTAPAVSADTTSNFTVTATDNENQSTARAYSITVTNIAPSGSFNVVTYTGNGGTQSITGVGFRPDLVWVKKRSAADDNAWFDSTRGAQKEILSNSNAAEATKSAAISSFDTDGFTTGNNGALNGSGATYVAWCFKANGGTTSSNSDGDITSTVQANDTLGFSIAKWTSTSSNTDTIGHGLSGKPDAVLYKKLSSTGSWFLYTDQIDGSWDELVLNATDAKSDFSGTYATSTTFRSLTSSAGADWITYSFRSIAGFSKIDKYTGNGSVNGPIVQTGFEPAFLMIKRTDGADNWYIVDNARSTSNPREAALFANLQDSEYATYAAKTNFYSNGFQIVSSDGSTNANGGTFLYMAFAADPDTTTPTLANSFDALTWSGQNSSLTINNGFKTGLLFTKARTVSHHWGGFDIVRGPGKWILPNESNAESSGSYGIEEFLATSTKLYGSFSPSNAASNTYVGYFWKADDNEPTINTDGTITSLVNVNDAAGFSIVKHAGNGTQGATVGHGLSAAPNLIIVKDLTGANHWMVGNSVSGWTKAMHLDLSNADNASNLYWNDTSPTSTVFSLGASGSSYNVSGNQYIAYCFRNISGYSKIGGYTGNATSGTNITTGFQPDFVLTKDLDNNDNWRLYDSARGFNKVLYPAISAGEDDNSTGISGVTSTGFTLGNGNLSNRSGADYIYMAYKIN